jgi:hypothetical protein
MALYNSEAIHGFPTGNLSLQLLDKINPQQVYFVCQIKKSFHFCFIHFLFKEIV